MKKKSILEKLQFESFASLSQEAGFVRKKYCGNDVFIRGLIEISNVCIRNCAYCGLRRDNTEKKAYQMTHDSVINSVKNVSAAGLHSTVIQSGDDPGYSREDLCEVIYNIKQLFPSMAVTLSLGERPLDDYKAFKDQGADRYLLKIETTNADNYRVLHPGQNLKKRLKILDYLRKIGYQIGTGSIVGLPSQTIENLADDLLFFSDLQPDMISISPFIPQKNTPLRNFSKGDTALTLKTIALSRIISKNALMPVATALATLDTVNGISKGLQAGCNVIMVNFTPDNLKSEFKIYDDKNNVPLETVGDIIQKADLKISFSRGESFKMA